MSKDFDPYHKWLGIPLREQPADHYRILGVERFESDTDVLSLAADQRMHFLRSFQNGDRAKLSQTLLNEVAKAKVCLLDPDKKVAYDKELRQKIANKKGEASHEVEMPNEDLAATLEFAAPEPAPEWPLSAGDESDGSNLWSPKREPSESQAKPRPSSSAIAKKTKRRVLIISLLTGVALTLTLAILTTNSGPDRKNISKSQTNSKALNQEDPKEKALAAEKQNSKEEGERKAKEEAERKAKEEAERKAKEEAERKAKEEAERKAKEETARRVREKSKQEEIRSAIQSLEQKVDLSLKKVARMKYTPDQALQVIRTTHSDIDKAQVPFRVKRAQKQKLQSASLEIKRLAADQRAKQKQEEEANWRREHPDEYLESLGLAKEKNTWVIEAVVEVNELNKPLAKLITEYKRKAKEIEKKETRIKQQETRLENGMKKLPGAFQSAEFRKWVMDGMQEYPNAPPGIRILVDKGREQFDRFRDRNPRIANELEQKMGQLQTMKMQYQSDIKALESTVDDISKMDRTARDLLRKIAKTEQRLDKKKINVQSAVQSSGIAYTPPDTTNIENLLGKSDEILEDDLVDSLRERTDARF